jgi:hypothetical protein
MPAWLRSHATAQAVPRIGRGPGEVPTRGQQKKRPRKQELKGWRSYPRQYSSSPNVRLPVVQMQAKNRRSPTRVTGLCNRAENPGNWALPCPVFRPGSDCLPSALDHPPSRYAGPYPLIDLEFRGHARFFLRSGCVPVPWAGIVGWRMGNRIAPREEISGIEFKFLRSKRRSTHGSGREGKADHR